MTIEQARKRPLKGFNVSEGDLNPEPGEISLNLDLNSETGEKSPDRGVHAAMVTGATWRASTPQRRLAS